MKTVLHSAQSRGRARHGWLDSHHTFSFAGYHNTERMHFGVLRVLNDDVVAPGMGFGRHPHDNMEIISLPLEGDLEHRDSMGNQAVIREGDIQVMSAGTGIQHSEYNANADLPVKFLQIWLFPRARNVQPRYDQLSIKDIAQPDTFFQILSPDPDDQGVWIHQDAWFHLGRFSRQLNLTHSLQREGNGLYVFMIEGDAQVAGHHLTSRDGLGIEDTRTVDFSLAANTTLLLMEVPMR
jgi:redox-sensitive bicupin YhaK (pirin superfamily)